MRARQCAITAVVVALPFALGGCGLAFDVAADQIVEAAARTSGRPIQPSPKPHPLADQAVTINGPLVITLGSQSVFEQADRRYLLDGLAKSLRRRFPQAVVLDSRQAVRTAEASTTLRLDTMRDASGAQPAVVQVMVRVYDSKQSLRSIVRSPAVAVDFNQPDRKGSIDELLAGLDGKLATVLLSP